MNKDIGVLLGTTNKEIWDEQAQFWPGLEKFRQHCYICVCEEPDCFMNCIQIIGGYFSTQSAFAGFLEELATKESKEDALLCYRNSEVYKKVHSKPLIYVLEYINENEEVEILRYNPRTKKYETMVSNGSSVNYDEPPSDTILFGIEEADMSEDNNPDPSHVADIGEVGKGGWIRTVGDFRIKKSEDDSYQHYAYTTIRELISDNIVPQFMDHMIDNLKRNDILNPDGTASNRVVSRTVIGEFDDEAARPPTLN